MRDCALYIEIYRYRDCSSNWQIGINRKKSNSACCVKRLARERSTRYRARATLPWQIIFVLDSIVFYTYVRPANGITSTNFRQYNFTQRSWISFPPPENFPRSNSTFRARTAARSPPQDLIFPSWVLNISIEVELFRSSSRRERKVIVGGLMGCSRDNSRPNLCLARKNEGERERERGGGKRVWRALIIPFCKSANLAKVVGESFRSGSRS